MQWPLDVAYFLHESTLVLRVFLCITLLINSLLRCSRASSRLFRGNHIPPCSRARAWPPRSVDDHDDDDIYDLRRVEVPPLVIIICGSNMCRSSPVPSLFGSCYGLSPPACWTRIRFCSRSPKFLLWTRISIFFITFDAVQCFSRPHLFSSLWWQITHESLVRRHPSMYPTFNLLQEMSACTQWQGIANLWWWQPWISTEVCTGEASTWK